MCDAYAAPHISEKPGDPRDGKGSEAKGKGRERERERERDQDVLYCIVRACRSAVTKLDFLFCKHAGMYASNLKWIYKTLFSIWQQK